MVLHKKAAGPSKRAQGKRAFEDNDSDSDFDGDSGEEMVVQKTPKNKTLQGRNSQSMSAKKVSFELSGKKTPQKNISFVGKKQPTPVAKGVKENKGVQKKKPQSEEMDVDDEDEDDDDFELDMDEDDDDDDDDDEEEDEEDDDEEEDEDEEEQEQIQKQKSNSKQPKNVTTPMKGADTSKKLTTPKAKTPKNEIKKRVDGNSEEEDDSDDSAEDEEEEQIQKQKNVKTPKANSPRNKGEENGDFKKMATVLEMDAIRRREIEIKTLYVGNLSTDVTPDDLKALSPDITEVFAQKNSKSPRRYAFIRFASEEKAVANHKALQGKKLNGQVLKICFTGEKANVYSPKNKCALNVKELFISGLPPSATIGDVAIHFPKANVVRMIRSTAKVSFEKEEDANEAYNLKEIEIHGCKLLIYHAKLDNASQINKGKYFRNYKKFEPSVKFPSYSGISKVGQKFEKYNPSKKMKFFKNG